MALLPAAAASSQSPEGVRLAVVTSIPSIPSSAPALIVRSRDRSTEDVILIKGSRLDRETLAASLGVLQSLRKKPRPDRDQFVTVTGGAALTPLRSDVVDVLDKRIELLNRQPLSQIGNLGTGRWVRLPTAAVK